MEQLFKLLFAQVNRVSPYESVTYGAALEAALTLKRKLFFAQAIRLKNALRLYLDEGDYLGTRSAPLVSYWEEGNNLSPKLK